MKRIYLDVCVYCRPFDDQNLLRVHLETSAYYLILQHICNGNYQSIVSPIHFQEVSAITQPEERSKVLELLTSFERPLTYETTQIRRRAEELYSLKFGSADAAHLAFAERFADIFLTCDDKLLKKSQKIPLSILVINPIEFSLLENLQ